MAGVTASRVVVRGSRAIGVETVDRAGAVQVTEGDHIVLAGGAAATPGILQRSGIGPSGLLESLGIPVVADLPVGDGIQDHVGFWLQLAHDDARPAANGARGQRDAALQLGAAAFASRRPAHRRGEPHRAGRRRGRVRGEARALPQPRHVADRVARPARGRRTSA